MLRVLINDINSKVISGEFCFNARAPKNNINLRIGGKLFLDNSLQVCNR